MNIRGKSVHYSLYIIPIHTRVPILYLSPLQSPLNIFEDQNFATNIISQYLDLSTPPPPHPHSHSIRESDH
jgi:hypothetical protein